MLLLPEDEDDVISRSVRLTLQVMFSAALKAAGETYHKDSSRHCIASNFDVITADVSQLLKQMYREAGKFSWQLTVTDGVKGSVWRETNF